MTAGGDWCVHSEMPESRRAGAGLSVWIESAGARQDYRTPIQEFAAGEIPNSKSGRGVSVKVIAGSVRGNRRIPSFSRATDPTYLDLASRRARSSCRSLTQDLRGFVDVFEGSLRSARPAASREGAHELAVPRGEKRSGSRA